MTHLTGTLCPLTILWPAAYDRKNTEVLGWEIVGLEAQTSGFKFKLNEGHKNLTEGALQPGVSYVIKINRSTKGFYVYIMVRGSDSP